MSPICNRVSLQGFYHPLTKYSHAGYVKAMIVNINGEDGHRYEQNHPRSPLYVPFTFKDSKYNLRQDKALIAVDITPETVNVLERRWRLDSLKIPEYDRERMNVILNRIGDSLEDLVEKAVPLGSKTLESRRRFLGIFPAPLREGIDELSCYGTIGGKHLEFRIYAEELPSVRVHNNAPSGLKKKTVPFHFFNH